MKFFLRGWLNVTALWISYATIGIPIYYGFGSLIGPLSTGMGVTLAAASVGFSIFVLVQGLMNPFVGLVINRIGTKMTMFTGAAIVVLSTLLMATVVNNVYVYYFIFGILLSFGSALAVPIAAVTNVSFWFVRLRATATAITVSGGGFGAMIFAPLVAWLAVNNENWKTTWFYLALITATGGLIVLAFVKNRPQDIGLLPDGDKIGDTAQVAKPAPKTRVFKTTDNWAPEAVFKMPVFFFIAFGAMTITYGLMSLIGFVVTYLTGVGIEKIVAAGAIGMYGLASIFGRLAGGVVCDVVEPKYVYALGFLIQAVSVVMLVTFRETPAIYTALVMYGIAFGMTFLSMQMMAVNWFGVKSFAVINSTLLFIAYMAGAFSPLVMSKIFEITKSFDYGWYIVITMAALSCFFALLSFPPQRKSVVK